MSERGLPPSPCCVPPDAGFRYLEHTADLAVEAWGRTRAEAVRQVLLATAALVIDPGEVKARGFVFTHRITAPDAVSAIVQAANEYLYLLDSEGLLLADVLVADVPLPADVEGVLLDITFVGDGLGAAEHPHETKSPPKAATYHNASLLFDRRQAQWYAHIILDL